MVSTKRKKMKNYDRDLIGYQGNPPKADFPNKARIAVQFVLNYEEGGENCILHGDKASEKFLSEIVGADARESVRHMNMESIYEFGSRAGFWRILKMFQERKLLATIFGVAMAMEKNPKAIESAMKLDWEIASHGYRWIEYQYFNKEQEREHLEKAIEIHKKVTGSSPQGWYTGRTSPYSRELTAENGSFLYNADSYADELPYWEKIKDFDPQLIVPYTLDANDMRFATPQGFNSGEQFYQYLKDTFDYLWMEGEQVPKIMSIGLHCRLVGRPGRAAALARFLDYICAKERVWICRRVDIAKLWRKQFPYQK
jgi:putative urate catabolism protein